VLVPNYSAIAPLSVNWYLHMFMHFSSNYRMDPNSSYLLKIRLFGNQKKARKEIRCFCFDKVIDSDLTNYNDLVESIIEQYAPRYLKVAHVQYYDSVLKILPKVKSDQDLLSIDVYACVCSCRQCWASKCRGL
jgi:hypothetical protein